MMRPSVPIALVLGCCSALVIAGPSAATPAPAAAPAASVSTKVPFVRAEAEKVVAVLADTLERDFVLPDAGKAYAAALRAKLGAGGYADFADAEAFAAAVTADLQAVHQDGHLRLFAPTLDKSGERRGAMTPPEDSTILAKGWLAPGIAYVSFSAFFGNDATMRELSDFLAQVKGAETLVIDTRKHRGGRLAEMNLIFSQLYAARTPLLDMDTREAVFTRMGDMFENEPRVERVAGPATVVRQRHWAVPAADPGLKDTKVYLLTSNSTASAAEHMALALKRTGRATIVGETTRGAGNYGGREMLGFGYSAFVPIGRTFDPATDRGWEGTGVAPDVIVPADSALGRALQLAGAKVDADKALAAVGRVRTSAP